VSFLDSAGQILVTLVIYEPNYFQLRPFPPDGHILGFFTKYDTICDPPGPTWSDFSHIGQP
jgi:hypothetical protein